MAKKTDPMLTTIVDLLPATGEIAYDDWKSQIINAGHYQAIPLTRAAKTAGLVKYRNQKNDQGGLDVLVSRVQPENS